MTYSANQQWLSEGLELNDRQEGGTLYELFAKDVRKIVDGLAPSQGCAANTRLFQQGAFAREVYFISRGVVKLVRMEDGGRELIVDLRFPNWFLGAATVVVERRHPVTAVTLSECDLHCIPVRVFNNLLETNAPLSFYLHRLHSKEILNQVARMAHLSCRSAEERLEHLLWQLTSMFRLSDSTAEAKVQLPLKYWEVAQLIAVTPEYLCRLLKKMHEKGVIRQERGWIIVTDFRKLWHPSPEELA